MLKVGVPLPNAVKFGDPAVAVKSRQLAKYETTFGNVTV
jgi:hypothetical protein